MVIAVVAIVHVFIAHFAVGAGIFNAFTETISLRSDNPTLRWFLRDNSHLIILLPFIGGAVTGVGIWFSIALVSPETTSVLIHLFLWAWATEWVFFLVEIIAGYIYYYSWGRVSDRVHCFIGWVYAISAFLSLVLINGIITFMLSPGESLDSSVRPFAFDFWAGLLNPTHWPSVILRTVSAVSIAAIFSMVLVNSSKKYSQSQRDSVVRLAGRFLLPLLVMVPAGVWYFMAVPAESLLYIKGGAIAMTLLFAFSLVASTLIGLYSYIAIIIRKRSVNLETAILLAAIALIATGAGEFVREGIRKPYLIWDHVYSNGMRKNEFSSLQEQLSAMPLDSATALHFSPWSIQPTDAGLSDERFLQMDINDIGLSRTDYPGQIIRGRWLYDAQCLRCHAIEGYNGMKPLVYQWSPKLINHTILNLHEVKAFMPPFIGKIRDRNDLTYYIHSLNGTCTDCHENLDDTGGVLDENLKVTLKDDWEDAK